ncbi:radical SAM protein with 4Fe4S-binding SPASM domain [Ruminiclostridium sufflavum DSM 19573]|uniref:Radical SAM protein with 4Fe4S-binding SPASM domain n=1 Tax=Ruminiclostridium sufflavum DSM 19573 TaxID=1121337 RepID=A0A318Y3L4_9FIRM|nr:PqqD family peptide modification chaperone [Ruminiclostridium sufflavum]PYG86621.1 radical SAM protein with 4Fe4S-binding SPASM domain [Ruminiclostridium sufflavum DSM 19573]
MQTLNDKTSLFDNYTNYLYKVENYESIIENEQDTYVLFNPSIHYWIALDDTGASIYNAIHNYNSMSLVKEKLTNQYQIEASTFEEDVLPFAEELLQNGFLSYTRTPAEAGWMSAVCDIDSAEKYPFNDIYISLTDKCNLNCIYCFNKEERHKRIQHKSNSLISKEKIIGLLKEFKNLKGSKVIFTGGEPTLRNELAEICREAKILGLETHFITNGTLLNSLDLEKLSEFVDSFTISLDSVIEKELEVLWGNTASNIKNDIFEALEKINQFSLNKKRLTVIIKPIVSAINLDSLDKLVSVISKKLCSCDLSWAMTQYSKIDDAGVNSLLSVSEKQYIKSVAKSLRNTYICNCSQNSDTSKKISGKINIFSFGHGGRLIPPDAPSILACYPSFFVTGNGDVYPCQCFKNDAYKLGNISNTSLSEMFKNNIFKKIRSKLPINQLEDEFCLKCELRFLCTNKLGPCAINKDKDKTNCKQINIQKLYLQTQLG